MSLIDSTVEAIVASGTEAVGLLASPMTLQTGLYEQALAEKGIRTIKPTKHELTDVEMLIRQVITGKPVAPEALEELVQVLLARGAQKVVLGCTELSVIHTEFSSGNLIDPLKVVTEKLLSGKRG